MDVRQLSHLDPVFLQTSPLERLKKSGKALELRLPSRPPPSERLGASLSFNQHFADSWARDELPLSQWDPHPERSEYFHTHLNKQHIPNGDASCRAQLSKLMGEVTRMNLPRARHGYYR